MSRKSMLSCAGCALALLLSSVAPASAQKITVKAATPNNGPQGSVNLDILIDGSGFGADSQAQFHVSGTTNPGGIRVNRTTRLSNAQLRANIDIDDVALLSYYDVKVVSGGRTGKGTDLFQVIQKGGGNACAVEPLDTTRFQLLGTLNPSIGGAPLYAGFGPDMKARRVTLTYAAGSREVVMAAVARGEASGRVEIFFLDPVTGAVLDGTAMIAGGPVQAHLTILPNQVAGTSSGGALAIGDVNADGLPDFVSQHNGSDRVTLMVATRAADGVIGYATTLVPPPTPSFKYGFAAAMGDLTGDGRDEIVLVRPFYQQGKTVLYPRIHVYTAPTGSPVLLASVAAPQTQTKSDSWYGVDVAVGDVTGDGRGDVLVAAPRWKVGDASEAGAVFLHAATGGPDVVAAVPIVLSGPSPTSRDHFGNRVDVANLDGDTSGQLDALSLDFWDSADITGDTFVGPLLAAGQPTSPPLGIAPRVGLTKGWGTRGAALGDLDGNGLIDIVVGAPNAPDSNCLNIGIAYVYLAQGTPATGTTGWARHSIQPPVADVDFGAFGWSTAAVDGTRLLLVGEPGRNIEAISGAGQVYIYRVLP